MTEQELEKEARRKAEEIEKPLTGVYSNDEDMARDDGYNDGYIMGYEDGYIAGTKSRSVKWHKKDEPPKGPINRLLLGCVKHYNSKKYMLVSWNGEWWYNANTWNTKVNLIVWCELPEFDSEVQ